MVRGTKGGIENISSFFLKIFSETAAIGGSDDSLIKFSTC
jgi:hypothetical protein